jgi:release factor glutamine methyltransferase
VLSWTKDYFRRSGIEAARLEAEILLAHALKTERLELYLTPDRTLTEQERSGYKALICLRARGTPSQYLLGETEFYHCRIKISPAALIPRPETEELVAYIVNDLASQARRPWQMLDLGTGSGAIAIALARAFPQARVLAIDVSPQALELAAENARYNRVQERLSFLQSNWYQGVTGTFDLIVSNPPYVSRCELTSLQREVHREPAIALDGGPSGLDCLTQIVGRSAEFLTPQGALYLELGENQATPVRQMIGETRAYGSVEILKDLSGKDRFARARRTADSVNHPTLHP